MPQRRTNPFVATFTTSGKGAASRAQVEGLYHALRPEAARGLPGASVSLAKVDGGRALRIEIEADSLRSLRAAVNSTLRLAALALEVAARASAAPEEE
jgi:tRNA threonylcarbamoyladenosine modification (KEOPS) complex  Pcc1 subunit